MFRESCVFFFQEEDGIRDSQVSGVQTCALPIYTVSGNNVGVNKTANVSGEVLSFLSTGIDTRVYFRS